MPFDDTTAAFVPDFSLARLAGMDEIACKEVLQRARWPESGGVPWCPRCGESNIYEMHRPSGGARLWRCANTECRREFTVSSATSLASSKLSASEILWSVSLFMMQAKGISSVSISHMMQNQQKTQWVLGHKIRECMLREQLGAPPLDGTVEIDGAYFGGYFERFNAVNQKTGKVAQRGAFGDRRVVMVARRRGGGTRTMVCDRESESIGWIKRICGTHARVVTDSAKAYAPLQEVFEHLKINHSVEFKNGDACTNLCESFFSEMRRKHMGVHHRMSGAYMSLYAAEVGWRRDNKQKSTDQKIWLVLQMLFLDGQRSAMSGYWQRAQEFDLPIEPEACLRSAD